MGPDPAGSDTERPYPAKPDPVRLDSDLTLLNLPQLDPTLLDLTPLDLTLLDLDLQVPTLQDSADPGATEADCPA